MRFHGSFNNKHRAMMTVWFESQGWNNPTWVPTETNRRFLRVYAREINVEKKEKKKSKIKNTPRLGDLLRFTFHRGAVGVKTNRYCYFSMEIREKIRRLLSHRFVNKGVDFFIHTRAFFFFFIVHYYISIVSPTPSVYFYSFSFYATIIAVETVGRKSP